MILRENVDGPWTSQRKLVTQERIQAVDVGQTFSKVAAKMVKLPHESTWTAFSAGFALRLFLFT